MRNMAFFIGSLAIPQGVTLLINFFLIRVLEDQSYKMFLSFYNSTLMASGVIIACLNRLIITERNKINEKSLFLFIVIASFIGCLISLSINNVEVNSYALVFATVLFICFYEYKRTSYQKRLEASNFFYVSIFRAFSYLLLVVVAYLYNAGVYYIVLSFLLSYIFASLWAILTLKSKDVFSGEEVIFSLELIGNNKALILYSSIIPFLLLLPTSLLIHSIPKEDEGLLKVWITAFSIYSVSNVITAGIKKYVLARSCSGKDTDSKTLNEVRKISLSMLFILPGLYLISIYNLPNLLGIEQGEFDFVLGILLLSSFFTCFLSPFSEFLQAMDCYVSLIYGAMINFLIMITLGSMCVFYNLGVIHMSFVFMLSFLVQNLYIYFTYKKLK